MALPPDQSNEVTGAQDDGLNRIPFKHPSLDGIENFARYSISEITSKERIATLALQIGLNDVVRWKPKNVGFPLAVSSLGQKLILASYRIIT